MTDAMSAPGPTAQARKQEEIMARPKKDPNALALTPEEKEARRLAAMEARSFRLRANMLADVRGSVYEAERAIRAGDYSMHDRWLNSAKTVLAMYEQRFNDKDESPMSVSTQAGTRNDASGGTAAPSEEGDNTGLS